MMCGGSEGARLLGLKLNFVLIRIGSEPGVPGPVAAVALLPHL